MAYLELKIDSANAEMQTPIDIADALNRVIDHLEYLPPTSVFGGPIKDVNGNQVGHYHGHGDIENA